LDEPEAIRRCQLGELDPFRFLVERYGKTLYGTAYLMTRDQGLAEDLVQETFLRAWRGMPSFRHSGSFKAWIVRILVNRAMSERRKRRVPEAPLAEAATSSGDQNGVEEMVLRRDERDRIRRALEKLSQEQRGAVILRYYTGLTVPQIASALGCRQGTVRSRLHRALARLREALAGGEEQTSLGEAG